MIMPSDFMKSMKTFSLSGKYGDAYHRVTEAFCDRISPREKESKLWQ